MTDTPRTEAGRRYVQQAKDARQLGLRRDYWSVEDIRTMVLAIEAEAAAGPRDELPPIGRNSLLGKSLTDEEFAAIAGRRDEGLRESLEQIRSYVFTTGDVTALGRFRLLGAIDAALAKASK